jgi:NlpC/P60 family.
MTADEARAAVIATARSLKSQLKYSNAWVGATVAQLKARRAGDCSDFTQAVYGAHGYAIGGMSYDQANDGAEVASWKGARGGANAAFIAIQSKLQPADLVCMAIDAARPGTISHVEIWIGDGISIGHGGPGYGPTEHAITDWNLLQSATYWTVRRIIPDTNDGEEELNQDQVAALTRIKATTDAMWKWMGGGSPATVFYRINQQLAQQQAQIAAQAAAIAKLAEAQGADGAEIANAISAAVAEKLKDLKITLITDVETGK